MKKEINFSKIITFSIIFSIIGTACGRLDEKGVSTKSVDDSLTSESGKLSENSTSDNSTLESTMYTERQIVEAICIELYGFNEKDGFNHADYMMNKAEILSERFLGNVISKEDAIAKTRSVLIEIVGAEFIESIESDFVELNGENIKYQRNNSPYNTTFYEEYDTWLIQPTLPSGTTKDGRPIMTPGMPPYVIMRESDGKVLAVFM